MKVFNKSGLSNKLMLLKFLLYLLSLPSTPNVLHSEERGMGNNLKESLKVKTHAV